MFWKFDLHTTSHIDTLLEKDDVTLAELMDEDDVLQECKSQNRKLVDFLVHPLAMQEMVRLITQEPAEDLEEKIRYKYPNVACELLTADVTQINDRLGDDEALLARLYAFLEQEPPLNPLLASFFSKIMGILISRKTEQIIDFLRKRDDFVGLLLKHIGTSAIMDLLFRLLTCVDPPKLKQDVLNWLNEQRLIQRLIELIHPSQDEDRHSNASQSLCDIIRLSREQINQVQENPEPDPLLTTLEKEETIEQLVSNMFDGEKNESALVNGIQVLLTLLETKRPTLEGQLDLFPQTTERPPVAVSGSTLQGIKARLKDFHALLLEPPKKNAMTTTIGVLEPPLGNTRLHVAKLVSAVLQTNTQALNQQLMQLDTIAVLLDLYFTYVWNNFLHLQVEQAVTTILNNPPSTEESGDGPGTEDGVDVRRENASVKSLFQRCQLVQRMLGAWESNEKEQEEGGRRRGYMGHLTRIANAVVQSAEKGPNALLIKELLTELPDDYRERWDVFVGSALVDINKKNTVDLVRSLVSPYNQHSSSEDDDADIKDIGFPPDASLQQAFSDYQMQQMTSNFVDQFGFSDEEFAEQEDNVNASFDRVSEINFAINANDESQNAALFEACCNERIQQFDDESGADEEDIWEEKQITYATNVKVRQRFGVLYSTSNTGKTSGDSGGSEESTDSEEDVEEEEDVSVKPCRHSANNNNAEDRMDVDGADASGPGWTARFDDVAMDTGGASADGDLAGRAGDSSSTSSSSSSSPAVVDTGSSLWENAGGSPGPGQQGLSWADFPDTKPKTSSLSVTGPRSSSPIAMETGPDTTDRTNKHAASQTADLPPVVKQQQKPEGGSSSLHTARAVAPGVPSDDDNSSSGGSDSDDHEEVVAAAAVGAPPSSSSAPGGAASSAGSRPGGCVVTETITTGSVQETVCLTMDAKSETAVFKSSDAADVVSSDDVPITEMSLSGSESLQSPVAQPSRTTGPADRSSPGHEEPGKDLAIAVPVENGPLEEVLPETLPRPEPLAAAEVMTSVSSA